MPSFEGRQLACQRGERLLFHHLDFKLEAGEALILTGANGSGKSSLLRLAAGLARPAAGGLFWDGRGIAEDMDLHHRRVIYLGHADGLKAGLTVGENLKFWHDLDGAAQAGQAHRGDAITGDPGEVAAALDLFGLAPLADLPARFLSAGQRRRTTLARLALARASSAQLWLLDEPTTALDQQGQGLLLALIERHCAAAGQVMLASHDPLAGLQGRRLRIDDDRLVAA